MQSPLLLDPDIEAGLLSPESQVVEQHFRGGIRKSWGCLSFRRMRWGDTQHMHASRKKKIKHETLMSAAFTVGFIIGHFELTSPSLEAQLSGLPREMFLDAWEVLTVVITILLGNTGSCKLSFF